MYSDGDQHDDDDEDQQPTVGELSAVAAASGIVSGIVLGPVVGVGVAVTAACVSITNTKAGQATRGAGSEMLKTKDKIQDYERKHQIINKSRLGVIRGCETVADKLRACGGLSKHPDDLAMLQ